MIKRFLNDEKGDVLVSSLIVLFIVFMMAFFALYGSHLYDMHEQISEEVERSLNLAIKEAMQDGRRLDAESYIDSNDTKEFFYDSLKKDMGLNESFKMIKDGKVIYSLKINNIEIEEEEARAKAKGIATYEANFGFFKKDIDIPINVKSKNMRLKEYE